MSAEKISKNQISKFKNFIPGEYLKALMNGEIGAIGGYFNGDPAGILMYEVFDRQIILRVLYVAPEFRRLGIATELMEALPEGKISFSYEAVGDRTTLGPFFDTIDVETERIDAPFADFTLKEAKLALERREAFDIPEAGIFYDEVDATQEKIILDWFRDSFNEKGLDDEVYDPASIFYIEDGKVKGAIFLRKDEPSVFDIIVNGPDKKPADLLAIDYLFCKAVDKKILPGMMNKFLKRLSSEHKEDTKVQGLIVNEKGQSLYRSLFGDIGISIPIIIGFCERIAVYS